MGTFVTQTDEPEVFADKSAAAGIRRRQGLTDDNVTRAADLNALKDAELDLRTALRALDFDALHFSATGDGATDDRAALNTLANTTMASGGVLALRGAGKTFLVGSSMTIPTTAALRIEKGAKISVAAGQTLTINGPFEAGLYQCFTGAGAVAFGQGATDIVRPEWWGAVGDGVMDSTSALTSALACAVSAGGTFRLMRGVYLSTSPLTVDLATVSPSFQGIEGAGYNSVLKATIATSGRAAVEYLGVSNPNSANLVLRNLRVRMSGGSSGAWCVRAGDARNMLLERLWLDGANGLRLKIASSASYAQVCTVVRECAIVSNYNNEWFADDATATVFAVAPESGGAKWDNVLFQSCAFTGLVHTRAEIAEFHNCQFNTNPARPNSGGYQYGDNVFCNLGSATLKDCYLESHRVGVYVTPTLGVVDKVSIVDCHFSGVSNYATSCSRAIEVATGGGVYSVGSVDLLRNKIRSDEYTLESVRCSTGRRFRAIGNTHLYDPTTAITYDVSAANFEIDDSATYQPGRVEKLHFTTTLAAVSTVYNPRVEDLSNAVRVPIMRRSWVSAVRVGVNALRTAGAFDVRILKNGVIQETLTYPTEFTVQTEGGAEAGYLLAPTSTLVFAAGDYLNIQAVTDASFAPVGTAIAVEIEMAF